MRKILFALTLLASLSFLLMGCGGSPPPPPEAPSVPANLTSEGSRGRIDLDWDASTGGNLQGYDVYKSGNGGFTFDKLNGVLVEDPGYSDYTVEDGIIYQYKVKAVGDAESDSSNVTKNIHGTRPPDAASGFTTDPTASPYVIEVDTIFTVIGGDLTVADGTKLYVMDGAAIRLEVGNELVVNGLLKVLATTANPATITGHNVVGPADGIQLNFSGADEGTTIQNTTVNNLRNSPISISGCSPVFYNAKFTSNMSAGTGYITVYNDGAPNIQHCRFEKMVLVIQTDERSNPTFLVEHNIFTGGYYAIEFTNLTNPGVNPGTIQYNDFECVSMSSSGPGCIYLSLMTGTEGDVPLENNYWTGGTGSPPAPIVWPGGGPGTTITADFDPVLAASPITTIYNGGYAGPDW